ncbi:transcriptional regulator, partial [Staphylococcus aureus]
MKALVKTNLVTTRKIGNKHLYQLNHNIFESVINNLSKVHTSNQRCICHNLKTGEC